MKANRLIKTN